MPGERIEHEIIFLKIEELGKRTGKLENSKTGQGKDIDHLKDEKDRLVFRLDKMEDDQKDYITVKGAQILLTLGGIVLTGFAIFVSWIISSAGAQ